MLNIEKYKDDILNSGNNDITCYVNHLTRGTCSNNCKECREHVMEWLSSEYTEPNLSKAEREYLSAVIKPFRDKVKFIRLPSYECLHLTDTCIRMYDDCGCELVKLPSFKVGTMYKGMELDRKYTLEELGL